MTPMLRKEDLDREYNNQLKVDHPERFFERYVEESEKTRKKLDCELNIAYGAGTDQTLDLFFPYARTRKAPVHIFFHGGYWKACTKDEFSFVADGFVYSDALTVVANYPKIPGVDMGTQVRQCEDIVLWARDRAREFGGDPEKIHLSGHSAGAHLIAMLMAADWEGRHGLPSRVVRSGCGISGLYDLEPIRRCFLNEALHLREEDVRRYSPVRLKPNAFEHLHLAVGGLEGIEYLRQSRDMHDRWSAWGPVSLEVMEGFHHYAIVHELANPNGVLTRRILNQMWPG